MRRRVIAVFGSSEDPHSEQAEPLGRWIAEQGFDLISGGGTGVMESACRGFASVQGRAGQSIGVLPGMDRPGYPNEWLDFVVRTHLVAKGEWELDPMSRNHINVLSCDRAVALPGSFGTRSELEMCVAYERPVIAWGWRFEQLPDACRHLPIAESFEDVARFLAEHP